MGKKEEKKAYLQGAASGAPAWMTTFGDLMTLLMTFFVLLFSMSVISEEKFAKILGSIESYFGIGESVITKQEDVKPEDILVRIMRELSEESEFGTLTENLEGFEARVTTIRDGLRITIGGKPGFDKYEVELPKELHPVLFEIADLVRGYPNRVRVVGHASPDEIPTAEMPFEKRDDLAFARAKNVSAFLIKMAKINPVRLEIASRGARDPIARNDRFGKVEKDSDGKLILLGREFNRRVEIIVSEELVPWDRFN